ncbi:MAG: hypothetical protein AAF658_05210, partial [Myxococcota bacterium]
MPDLAVEPARTDVPREVTVPALPTQVADTSKPADKTPVDTVEKTDVCAVGLFIGSGFANSMAKACQAMLDGLKTPGVAPAQAPAPVPAPAPANTNTPRTLIGEHRKARVADECPRRVCVGGSRCRNRCGSLSGSDS